MSIDEMDAEMDRQLDLMLDLIPVLKGKFRTGTQGTHECPVCQKDLSVSRAGSNGHLWVRCATDGCMRFME